MGSPSTTIHSNNFDVPCGGAEQTYAIFVESCSGFEIRENCIQATDGVDCTERRGLVLSNTNFDEENQETYDVNENSFIDMRIGTQFDGNNRNAQLRCNYYRSPNGTDWLISNSGIIDNQPDIFGGTSGLTAFSGRWDETKNASHYHIDNKSNVVVDNVTNETFTLEIYHDASSEPTITEGNVDPKNASDEGISETISCVYDNCEGIEGMSQPGGNDGEADTANPNCIKNIGKQVRSNLRMAKIEEAVLLLECAQMVWTDKVLTATYVSGRDFDKALTTLERIPDDTPNNTNFKNLFYAVIQEQKEGSGKKLYTELATTDFVEQPTLKKQQPIAESLLAGLLGNTYNREAESITQNNDATNNLTKNEILVYPNPASEQIRLAIDIEPNLTYKIYNLNGQQQKTGQLTENTTINIQDLNMGMYYIELSNGKTSRFVVVK